MFFFLQVAKTSLPGKTFCGVFKPIHALKYWYSYLEVLPHSIDKQVCGGEVHGTAGKIDFKYSGSGFVRCRFNVTVTAGHTIKLTFEEMEVKISKFFSKNPSKRFNLGFRLTEL